MNFVDWVMIALCIAVLLMMMFLGYVIGYGHGVESEKKLYRKIHQSRPKKIE